VETLEVLDVSGCEKVARHGNIDRRFY